MGGTCSKEGCGRRYCCQESHEKGEFGDGPYDTHPENSQNTTSEKQTTKNRYPTGQNIQDLLANVQASLGNKGERPDGEEDGDYYEGKKRKFESGSNYKKLNYNEEDYQQQRESGYFKGGNPTKDDTKNDSLKHRNSQGHVLVESNYNNMHHLADNQYTVQRRDSEKYRSSSSNAQHQATDINSTKIGNSSAGDGLIYKGAKKGELRHGQGVLIWPDGSIYEGSWVDGKASGKGKFTSPNGDTYEGEFSNDMASGRGVFKTRDAKFDGTWWDDFQHGNGTEEWASGSKYEGSYHKGKKSGYGRYVWPDKSEYTGDWRDNTITGIGRLVWTDGRQYDGQWRNNLKHGRGKHIWPDGRKYQGSYRNDKRHGMGKLTLPDGSYYSGEWENNLRHGKGIESRAGQSSSQGIWEHGSFKKWLN